MEDCGRETIEGRVSLSFVNGKRKYEAIDSVTHKEDEKGAVSGQWQLAYTNTQSNRYFIGQHLEGSHANEV